MIPRATYRMQFHKGFAFADAVPLASYLAKLGISHLYSSPIFTARAGSTHGYDVIDHSHINPELGGEDGFRKLAAVLKREGIGIILDIVPNHMAVGGADNPYWLDLLEKGADSVFANMFDIDWEPAQESLRDKVLVPLLGDRMRDAVDAGDLALIWDERLGKYAFAYADHRFPLRNADYAEVERDLAAANAPDRLRALLERQNFRLAFWRDAAERINWRRFFDINELAALRIEDDGVFEMVHGTVFRLYGEGLIDGVRVDHVDGLADPGAYCRKLRARLDALALHRADKSPSYIVVEKILAAGESLPESWGVDGTTGYDFMDRVSALQHATDHADRLARFWADLSGRSPDFEAEEATARAEILEHSFASQLRATATAFAEAWPDIPQSDFEHALTAVLTRFHAYRTYADMPSRFFEEAYAEAQSVAAGPALEAIAAAIGGRAEAADAARRFNQLAAPVAAKAVEDTGFYRYGRLLSRNDVGFAPAHFGITADRFLAQMRARPPHAMLATATHDHKRGADGRARLAVLSEIPDLWEKEVRSWFDINARHRREAITAGDEYQLYQTLVGAWPIETDRVLAWREKSLREAKLGTSWAAPKAEFEAAHKEFVRAILDDAGFCARLDAFVSKIHPAGVLNSLVQCVLHYTVPGIPDLYQGTELYDFSLVDPDNRRAVDYALRRRLLDARSDLRDWQSGGAKLALIRRLLTLRREVPDEFEAEPQRVDAPANVLAFRRGPLLVAVPLQCARACIERGAPLPSLAGPIDAPGAWRNALDPAAPPVTSLDAAAVFAKFPAAVLLS